MNNTSPDVRTYVPIYEMTAGALAAGPLLGVPLSFAICYPKNWAVQALWHAFIDLTGFDRMAVGAMVDEVAPFLLFIWLITAPIAAILLWVRSRSMSAPALLMVPVVVFGPPWLAHNLGLLSPLLLSGLQLATRLTLLILAVISVMAAWQLVRPLPRHPTT